MPDDTDDDLVKRISDGGAGLTAFGTALERMSAEALLRAGSVQVAASTVGLTPEQLRAHLSELERSAARRGYSPAHDMTKPVPVGFGVKGVSTYYGPDGELKGQWVKSQADAQHRFESLLRAAETMVEPFKGAAEPAAPPAVSNDDLLTVYPMGDPHIGMYSWAEETGENFDLEVAEQTLVAAVDRLVDLAPPSRQALIVNLGDFFHADNPSNMTTRSGAVLDVDTRWAKVLSVGIRAMRRAIDRSLEKHEQVRVINEIGNHDDVSAVMLSLCLDAYYDREPRVEIDTSPARFHWHRFGDCLFGVTHGVGIKREQLPGIMATDRAQDWGETKYRFWLIGHVHHDRLTDFPGCTVESFRTLAARDAWHTASGYRSQRDMKCDVYHRKYGRIARHVVGINQLI